MNKNDMLQQLQNLLGLKNDFCEEPEKNESIAECVDELAEMFCDGAVILSRIADQIQRETDAMTAAFNAYSAELLTKGKRPSVLKTLHKLIDAVKDIPAKAVNRDKQREQSR